MISGFPIATQLDKVQVESTEVMSQASDYIHAQINNNTKHLKDASRLNHSTEKLELESQFSQSDSRVVTDNKTCLAANVN